MLAALSKKNETETSCAGWQKAKPWVDLHAQKTSGKQISPSSTKMLAICGGLGVECFDSSSSANEGRKNTL